MAGRPAPCTVATNEDPPGRVSVTLSVRGSLRGPGRPSEPGLGQEHPVAAVDRVERRDVEPLRGLGPAAVVGVQQVGVPLPVGVVHLGHHAGQRAVGPVAPEDGQRVEHVAEHAGVGEHHHPAAGQVDAVGFEEEVEVFADRPPGVTQVVAAVEARQQPQARAEPGQVVQVDQPLVGAVGERVPQRRQPGVGDPAFVQHGARGHRARPGRHQLPRHQVPPSASAARAPDRQPSSWKPQPW